MNQCFRNVGSISKTWGGGTTLRGHFFPQEKGPFSKSKKDTSLFIGKSGGTSTQCPCGSYLHAMFEGSFEYDTKLIVMDGGGIETTCAMLWAPSTETILGQGCIVRSTMASHEQR